MSTPFRIPPRAPSPPPSGPGAPITRCIPDGPDPYAEDRIKAREDARKGEPCPTNQHGCYYFSKSDWIFCPMCEWMQGHHEGVDKYNLIYMGDRYNEHRVDVLLGDTILVSREAIDTIFKDLKSYLGPMSTTMWDKFSKDSWKPREGHILLTRKRLHNTLMVFGAPDKCVTDEVWADLKARYPVDTDPEKAATRKALADKFNEIMSKKSYIMHNEDLCNADTHEEWEDLEDIEGDLISALDMLDEPFASDCWGPGEMYRFDETLASIGAKPYRPK